MEITYNQLCKPGSRLGSGEFGRIFESIHNGQKVVLKIMKHAIHSSIFYNEIEIMRQLDHENIPKLIGYCKENSFMCIIIEKALGMDLYYYIKYYDLSMSNKIHISLQIIETLEYIHSKGIIYRDLKPENIIIDYQNMTIKLIDFGLAILADESNEIAGTMGYIAPEVLEEKWYNFSADIFSYGMTLFVLWTEHYPHKILKIPSYIRFLPSSIQTVIRGCTRMNPNKRFSSTKIKEVLLFEQLPDTKCWNCICS